MAPSLLQSSPQAHQVVCWTHFHCNRCCCFLSSPQRHGAEHCMCSQLGPQYPEWAAK